MGYKRQSPMPVVEGGTGNQSFTAYSVITGGTTSTGALQNVVGVGTSGQVLTSAGAGALPAWAGAPASSISITGDTGGALTGNSFTFTGGTTGLSFGGSGSTQTLTFAGITANGGTVSLATDATNSTVNIGTGAGAKTVTLGSTNGASVTAIRYGTADFTLASATGTVMSALDTGEIIYPLQPAFLGILSSSDNNVTGDGTTFTVGSGNVYTEIFDQNGDFVTTGTFTAPVTGRYQLNATVLMDQLITAMQPTITIFTSNRSYVVGNDGTSLATRMEMAFSVLVDMDAADTSRFEVTVGNGTKVVDILADRTFFSGYLAC